MSKDANLTVDELFEVYIKKCIIKNLSEQTIKGYKVNYNVFEKFIKGITPINEITSNTIDNYILYLRENNTCNDVTINSYLRSIRAFFISVWKVVILKDLLFTFQR